MSRNRLAELPALVWQSFCTHLEFSDLFKLSICCEHFRELISFGKHKIAEICFSSAVYDGVLVTVHMKEKRSTQIHVRPTGFPHKYKSPNMSISTWRVRKVKFSVVLFSNKEQRGREIYLYCDRVHDGTIALVSHIFSFMTQPPGKLTLMMRDSLLVDKLIASDIVLNADSVTLSAQGLSRSTTKQLLCRMQPIKALKLRTAPLESEDPEEFEEIRNVDELDICEPGWFKEGFLLSLNCKIIRVHRELLDVDDVNLFLRNWEEGSAERLESLHVYCPGCFEEDVVKGVGAMVWDGKGRDTHYLLEDEKLFRTWIDCSRAYDIERPDGLFGTVKVDRNHIIRFLVWREKFPFQEYTAQLFDPHYKGDEIAQKRYRIG